MFDWMLFFMTLRRYLNGPHCRSVYPRFSPVARRLESSFRPSLSQGQTRQITVVSRYCHSMATAVKRQRKTSKACLFPQYDGKPYFTVIDRLTV